MRDFGRERAARIVAVRLRLVVEDLDDGSSEGVRERQQRELDDRIVLRAETRRLAVDVEPAPKLRILRLQKRPAAHTPMDPSEVTFRRQFGRDRGENFSLPYGVADCAAPPVSKRRSRSGPNLHPRDTHHCADGLFARNKHLVHVRERMQPRVVPCASARRRRRGGILLGLTSVLTPAHTFVKNTFVGYYLWSTGKCIA